MVKKRESNRAVEQFNGRGRRNSDFLFALFITFWRGWRRFRATSSSLFNDLRIKFNNYLTRQFEPRIDKYFEPNVKQKHGKFLSSFSRR